MRAPSFSCSWLNFRSLSRTAVTSLIGMLTSPKLMLPLQIARAMGQPPSPLLLNVLGLVAAGTDPAQVHPRRKADLLPDDGLRRLVRPQAFEGRLPQVALRGQAGELDLAHQVGLHPVHDAASLVAHQGRRRERGRLAGPSAEFRLQVVEEVVLEAGADAADELQLPRRIVEAEEQRPEVCRTRPFARRPAT